MSLELAGEFFATEPLGVSLKRFTVTLKEMLWVFVTVQAFSSCSAWASHCCGFSCCRARALGQGLSSCGPQASLPRGMWNPPRAGTKPMSSALPSGFLTTAPRGRSLEGFLRTLNVTSKPKIILFLLSRSP